MNQAERDLKRLRELCMEHGCGHVLMIFDGSYGVGAPSSAPSEIADSGALADLLMDSLKEAGHVIGLATALHVVNAMRFRTIPSATPCSGWVSVLEKLPESHGDVLVAHPVFSQSSAEMFGVAIRPAYMVRAWMSDKKDDSMRGAYWQNLPKGPA